MIPLPAGENPQVIINLNVLQTKGCFDTNLRLTLKGKKFSEESLLLKMLSHYQVYMTTWVNLMNYLDGQHLN